MGAVCQGSGLAADITNARIATLRIRRDYTDALDFAVVKLKRPKGFAPLDPLGVPLPHGTEVTARVPRMLGERRVPKGVVGRVVKVHDEGSVDVAITRLREKLGSYAKCVHTVTGLGYQWDPDRWTEPA